MLVFEISHSGGLNSVAGVRVDAVETLYASSLKCRACEIIHFGMFSPHNSSSYLLEGLIILSAIDSLCLSDCLDIKLWSAAADFLQHIISVPQTPWTLCLLLILCDSLTQDFVHALWKFAQVYNLLNLLGHCLFVVYSFEALWFFFSLYCTPMEMQVVSFMSVLAAFTVHACMHGLCKCSCCAFHDTQHTWFPVTHA